MSTGHGRLRRISALVGVLAFALLVVPTPLPASAQGCGIGLSADVGSINFPWSSIPPPGSVTFSQTFNVNYSSSFVNRTLTIQYLNGSQWFDLENFTGNPVGFTRVGYGLDNGWIRFGTDSVRVLGDGCVSNVVTFGVGHDSSAWLTDLGAYAALAAAGAALLYLGKGLGWKRFLVLALPVYLVLAPWTGQRYDVYFLLSSGIRLLQHVNPFDPGNPQLYPGALKWAYPPLYAAYSAFSFAIFQVITGASLPTVGALTYPGWLTATYDIYLAYVPQTLPILVFILKLPMVASTVCTAILLRRMTGKDSSAVVWIANPVVVLVSAIWGQIDPIATVLVIAAIYFYRNGREYQAYLLASLGAAVKVYPLLIIPFMLVMSLRKRGLEALKPLSAALPAFLATVGIYSAFGNPLDALYVLIYARGIPTFAGAFTVNGLTWQQALFVLKTPPVPLFLYIGIPVYVLALAWVYVKHDQDLIKWSVVSILIFFLTYNYVNPQYFYWILPLLILQGRRFSTAVFTVLPMMAIAFSYNIYYFVSPALLPDIFSFGASVLEQLKVNWFYQSSLPLVLVLGAIPTASYALLVYRELRSGRADAPRDTGNV